MKTTQIIEALLFASDAPLSADDLARGEEELEPDAVAEAIATLRREYEQQGRAFQIYEIAGGYQLLTRPEFSPHLERFETVPKSTRLSGAALEVLAIIAYRQPLGRAEVEEIRGVGSSHVLRTLHELDLIDIVGRGEGLGRPLLYGTTQRFLDHFGFAALDDLPRPDELPVILAERPAPDGEGAEQPGEDVIHGGAADASTVETGEEGEEEVEEERDVEVDVDVDDEVGGEAVSQEAESVAEAGDEGGMDPKPEPGEEAVPNTNTTTNTNQP